MEICSVYLKADYGTYFQHTSDVYKPQK